MKVFAVLVTLAAAAVAQQIGSDGGFTASEGSAAVSNANTNNGQQFQNSLVSTGDKGGNFFHDLTGNTFVDSASNLGLMDNNMINPSQTSVAGNSGSTTNGANNHIGDILGQGFWKRDAIFNNNFGAGYVHGFAYHPQAPVAWGYPAVPLVAPVYGYPVAQPAHFAAPAAYYPAAHINHNVQSADIVQNQA
ncbi:hypothetical protein H4R19_005376 [Coemansia spiralis]|nr:hypothetical protein H4R19_005376 [Coemansia spiralis]